MVYVNPLIADAQAELTPPVSEEDHAVGPANAPVTLVEYGDFECPHCGEGYRIVKQLQERFADRLRFVFRHFPLSDIHPFAQSAAEAAEAAGAQGKFWPMYNELFTHQRQLDQEWLAQYAGAIGLDTERFESDLAQHVYAGRVQADIESGLASGVQGTPTYFINGVRYQGWNGLSDLAAAIESAIAG